MLLAVRIVSPGDIRWDRDDARIAEDGKADFMAALEMKTGLARVETFSSAVNEATPFNLTALS